MTRTSSFMENHPFLRYPFLFSLFLIFPLQLLLFSVPAVRSASDAEALFALKSSIDPLNLLKWSGKNVCKWEGIKECMNGRITKLVLEHLNLSGTLDEQSLNKLDQLRVLSFKDNSLSGQIPDLSGLANLKSLFLNDNNFSGDFPASISLHHRLKVVVLSGNQINGHIPESLLNLRRLYVLYLHDNRLTGDIPGFNQTGLRFFNVSNNQLSGEIPATPALDRFNLSSFSGNINLCGEQINRPCNESNDGLPPSISPDGNTEPESKHSKRKKLIWIIVGNLVFCEPGDQQMNYSSEDLLKASAETLGRDTMGSGSSFNQILGIKRGQARDGYMENSRATYEACHLASTDLGSGNFHWNLEDVAKSIVCMMMSGPCLTG